MESSISNALDDTSIWERLTYASGALFVVLLIVAAVLFPMAPSATDTSATHYAAWLVDHHDAVLGQAYLRGLAAVVQLVFIGGLASLLWRRSGTRPLPLLLFGAGLLHTGILFVSNGALATAAIAARAGVDDSSLRTVGVFSDTVLTLEAFAEAVLFATAAALLLRTRAVPRWLGWFSFLGVPLAFVDAAGFLGSPVEFIGMLALFFSLVWFLALSVALLLDSRAKSTVPASHPLPA
jgi:hypothetical protein